MGQVIAGVNDEGGGNVSGFSMRQSKLRDMEIRDFCQKTEDAAAGGFSCDPLLASVEWDAVRRTQPQRCSV